MRWACASLRHEGGSIPCDVWLGYFRCGGSGGATLVGPILFLSGHARGGFDEAGFAYAGAVLEGEIDTTAGVDIGATLAALVFAVLFARFYHFWLILGSALD